VVRTSKGEERGEGSTYWDSRDSDAYLVKGARRRSGSGGTSSSVLGVASTSSPSHIHVYVDDYYLNSTVLVYQRTLFSDHLIVSFLRTTWQTDHFAGQLPVQGHFSRPPDKVCIIHHSFLFIVFPAPRPKKKSFFLANTKILYSQHDDKNSTNTRQTSRRWCRCSQGGVSTSRRYL
jgi:hypothetical protein